MPLLTDPGRNCTSEENKDKQKLRLYTEAWESHPACLDFPPMVPKPSHNLKNLQFVCHFSVCWGLVLSLHPNIQNLLQPGPNHRGLEIGLELKPALVLCNISSTLLSKHGDRKKAVGKTDCVIPELSQFSLDILDNYCKIQLQKNKNNTMLSVFGLVRYVYRPVFNGIVNVSI